MRFDRFTKGGFVTNWGWYSPVEKDLLAKEDEVGKMLAALEDFVRAKPPVKWLLTRFNQIQHNDAVKEADCGALAVELDGMIKEAKEIRLNVLNRGGDDIPDAPKTFPNHHPNALIGEIRTFLDYRMNNRAKGDPLHAGFVIHWHPTTQVDFDKIVTTGAKVLYTLDVDGILSIGDPRSTKHSVVAVGKTCKAAGTAQLDIDDRTDMYKSMQDYQQRADNLKLTLKDKGDPKGEFAANVAYLEQQAKELEITLAGYIPPPAVTRGVLIDFDSGHYAPSEAWKEAMGSWKTAGYTAKWSPSSRRV